MSFTYPLVLVLLIIPAMLAAWIWTHRGGRLVLPFDHGVQPSGRVLRIALDFAQTIPAVLLAIAIIMLAGPQRVGEPMSQKVLTNIEFCIDVSGSMTAPFGNGTRYDASMAAVEDFLDYREGDAFGLTFFGNEVLHWVPLTNDVSAIRCAPPFMNPSNPGHPPWLGGTAIGKALMSCREVLTSREVGDRMLILVSDGSSFDLYNNRDMEIARKLKNDNIRVYGVHISNSDIPDPVVNICRLTGGEIFEPGDPSGLKSVFQRIDEMQETRMEKISSETMDYFEPYSLAGLSVLALSLISLMGFRYTPW